MSKNSVKKRKPAKKAPKKVDVIEQAITQSIKEHMPPGHNFYEEIGATALDALLKLKLKGAIDTIQSPERFLRNYLIDLIRKREISKLASREFANIVKMARANPLDRVVTRCLEVIYDEYTLIKKHLSKFDEKSFRDRFELALKSFESKEWILIPITDDFKTKFEDDKKRAFYPAKLEGFFNDNGQITQNFTVIFKSTEGFDEAATTLFENGLLCHKIGEVGNYHSATICPENNVPGVPFVPWSIKKQSRRDNLKILINLRE